MSKTICLDAGHYGKYNRSPAVPEYYESEMNWKLHNLLAKELEQYGFTVIKTRENKDKDLGLTTRGKKAKGCDLFISIHSNAVSNGINEDVDYPVVYVPINGTADDIGNTLAVLVGDIMGTKQKGYTSKRAGNNGDYYGVIRGSVSVGVPGIIIEHSFHTNTKSTNWLMSETNLAVMAKAEAKAIAKHFGVNKPITYYRVQVGAYKNIDNAKNIANKLRANGINTYLVESGGYFKVQVGAYTIRANASAFASKLRDTGYNTYITTRTGVPVKEG